MTTEALPTRAGAPTVLIVPGLRGDVAEHWQVHLQARLPGAVSVPTLGEHERLSCAAQVASLDAALVRITAPVILVAHSGGVITVAHRSEEHTSELQSLMRISYAVFCLKKKKQS